MSSVSEEHASTISEDVQCIRCRYNLRGLSPGGRCPECGEKIALSLRHDDPADQRRRWARTLRLGILVFICSGAVSMLSMLFTWGLRRVSNQDPGVGALMTMNFVGPKVYCMSWFLMLAQGSVVSLLLPVSVLLNIAAILLITVAGERLRDEGRITQRGMVRLIAGASIGSALALVLQAEVGDVMLMALIVFLEAVPTTLLYWYLMVIAVRLPNPRLAWNLHALCWSIIALFAIMILWIAADLRLGRAQRTLPLAIYVGASWAVALWAAGILLELSRSLKALRSDS
jgi:DNA-directed RNA polymerase subunit RPC12/RpoP